MYSLSTLCSSYYIYCFFTDQKKKIIIHGGFSGFTVLGSRHIRLKKAWNGMKTHLDLGLEDSPELDSD